jgi:hypothetical protein
MKRSTLIRALVLIATCGFASQVEAALSVYVSPERLAEGASRIVQGVVVDVSSGIDPESNALSTYITLDVDSVLRGPDTPRVTLREPGGRFGNRVHELDAVPTYHVGEHVLVFLETAPDGALRTRSMFFGKYRVDNDPNVSGSSVAIRDLDGRGRILGGPAAKREIVRYRDLVAIAASVPVIRGVAPGDDQPAELHRIQWNRTSADLDRRTPGRRLPSATPTPAETTQPKFTALSVNHPTRWPGTDNGTPIVFDVERARDPLGNPAAAIAQIQTAIDAWTNVPQSRVSLRIGNDNALFTASHPNSPARSEPSRNIVLFGDPYGDISPPVNCSGVLAIGGYWRTDTVTSSVNGIAFHPALKGYVIFNAGFECLLGDADALAEVATHEIGHALGFGHSFAWDSIMRSYPYTAGRGARLGDDDRDAAHCHYPHLLDITGPQAGTTLEAGTVRGISWSATAEDGADPGTMDIQRSTDGGPWETLATSVANDGYYGWLVEGPASNDVRLRVVRPNINPSLPGYPTACSTSLPTASLVVTTPPPVAGGVGSSLRLQTSGDDVRLNWGSSCSADVDTYAIYEGSLTALRAGTWDAQPAECSTGSVGAHYLRPLRGPRFFLLVPSAGNVEGHPGRASDASLRPMPQTTCGRPVESTDVCSP